MNIFCKIKEKKNYHNNNFKDPWNLFTYSYSYKTQRKNDCFWRVCTKNEFSDSLWIFCTSSMFLWNISKDLLFLLKKYQQMLFFCYFSGVSYINRFTLLQKNTRYVHIRSFSRLKCAHETDTSCYPEKDNMQQSIYFEIHIFCSSTLLNSSQLFTTLYNSLQNKKLQTNSVIVSHYRALF